MNALKAVTIALAVLMVGTAQAEVASTKATGGEYRYQTAWAEFVEMVGCIRTTSYVGITVDTTKALRKGERYPANVSVSIYSYDQCTGEYQTSAWGSVENPKWSWDQKRSVIKVDDVVNVVGQVGDVTYVQPFQVNLTWSKPTDPQRYEGKWTFENRCVKSISGYESTSRTTEVTGVVDNGKTVPEYYEEVISGEPRGEVRSGRERGYSYWWERRKKGC